MRKRQPPPKSLTAEEAMIAANRYLLLHYPTMYTGATPRRLILPRKVLQCPSSSRIPIMARSGTVGVIAVDAMSGQIVGATPRSEIVATGKKLREAVTCS